MKRRDFLGALGGAVAAWPLAASAQERVRRVGVLMGSGADDAEMQALIAVFVQGLQQAGWIVGRNLRVDVRSSGGDSTSLRMEAEQLFALGAEVILAGSGPTTNVLRQMDRAVPVVFAQSLDPVGNGFVASMSHPGGNITGFTQFEYVLCAKWLELLKEVAPQVARVGVARELAGPAGIGQWAVIAAAASPLGVELTPINVRVAGEIERAVPALARASGGGLIVVVGAFSAAQRSQIVTLAAQHRLPAVYAHRHYVEAGGLMSYGTDLNQTYRRAAGYVDRILKGEKPADLPVQAPTKYELVINLKTAKILGMTVSPSLLARADEVIE
jgi:putative ABC transport system substrate-binding protein